MTPLLRRGSRLRLKGTVKFPSLGDDLLVGLANVFIGGNAIFCRTKVVNKSRRLQHSPESGENVQMRSRIAADDEEEHVCHHMMRSTERDSRRKASERDHRLTERVRQWITRVRDRNAILEGRR